METTKPVRSNQPEAAATSPQPKKFVKVKSGATLVSTTYFNPASNPEASPPANDCRDNSFEKEGELDRPR